MHGSNHITSKELAEWLKEVVAEDPAKADTQERTPDPPDYKSAKDQDNPRDHPPRGHDRKASLAA
jgi:hypothetical protein